MTGRRELVFYPMEKRQFQAGEYSAFLPCDAVLSEGVMQHFLTTWRSTVWEAHAALRHDGCKILLPVDGFLLDYFIFAGIKQSGT